MQTLNFAVDDCVRKVFSVDGAKVASDAGG
jgi:hypothetical protein